MNTGQDTNTPLNTATRRIRQVLAGSPVQEDAGHAENTVVWLRRLDPNANEAQCLAALAHDIERARPDRLRREEFSDYDDFKRRHAFISAEITDQILVDAGISNTIRCQVWPQICRHEHGGDVLSDLLKDADSLSYFDHNLPFYFAREGWDETLRRARWGYARLSERARQHYAQIRPASPVLRHLLWKAKETSHG